MGHTIRDNIESRADNCHCWVAAQPTEDRFFIRYGAHALACPVYRESGDPVDRAADVALRERHDLYITDDDAEENAGRGLLLRIL